MAWNRVVAVARTLRPRHELRDVARAGGKVDYIYDRERTFKPVRSLKFHRAREQVRTNTNSKD